MERSGSRVAIYCRLSEEDRFKSNAGDDSGSIINQKAMLTEYCEERGWEVYRIYSDDDFTGSDRRRPAFRELLSGAENREFDIILCKTQSRFTRELELVEKYINYLFPLWGIRFISIVDNADTAVKSNKKTRQINGLINEWYLEDMSDNIRAVLTNRRRNGFFIGAFAPYGYKKDSENRGHLIIDEEAAEVVRLIFELYVRGLGRTAIARELNARHIPTPADYKKAHGERYSNGAKMGGGHLWRYYTVSSILTSEVYIGNLVQNKSHSVSYKTKLVKPTPRAEWIRVTDTHEPVVDRGIWNKAQEILNSRTKRKTASGFVNIFSGKVFCGLCGRRMTVSKASNGGRYLICQTKKYSPAECHGTRINYNYLYTHILKDFQGALATESAKLDEKFVGEFIEKIIVHEKLPYSRDYNYELIRKLNKM